jgi:hypothetical protein
MKVSFDEAVEAQVIEEAGSKAVAVRPESKVATIAGEDPTKGIYGEFGADDVRLPRLNLVNKVGDLSNLFTPGTWVINKEHQITEIDANNKGLGGALRVIAVRLKVEYQESLPYDPDVRPRVFQTAEEVRLAGGQVAYGRGEGKFAKAGHIEFLIQEPETLSEEAAASFFYVLGDKRYARVIYTASSTAYAETAQILYSDYKVGHLNKTGLSGGFYSLGAKIKTGDKGTWWIPSMKTAGEVPTELQQQIAELT